MRTVDPLEPKVANQSLMIRITRRRIDPNKLDEDNNEKEVNHAEHNDNNGETNP